MRSFDNSIYLNVESLKFQITSEINPIVEIKMKTSISKGFIHVYILSNNMLMNFKKEKILTSNCQDNKKSVINVKNLHIFFHRRYTFFLNFEKNKSSSVNYLKRILVFSVQLKKIFQEFEQKVFKKTCKT